MALTPALSQRERGFHGVQAPRLHTSHSHCKEPISWLLLLRLLRNLGVLCVRLFGSAVRLLQASHRLRRL